MKSRFQSPLRARLRDFARTFREKSHLPRLKTKKSEPTLNPAPMSRIKGWLNAHDLLPPKGKR
jgi:hypothetical protein